MVDFLRWPGQEKMFLRKGEVMALLGLTKYQLGCLVDSGSLKQTTIPGMKQRVYKHTEVKKFINTNTQGENDNEGNKYS